MNMSSSEHPITVLPYTVCLLRLTPLKRPNLATTPY